MAGEAPPAEIEILDGAGQIARQKAETDARCRALALPAAAADDASGRKLGHRPPRGQWLARLGLKKLGRALTEKGEVEELNRGAAGQRHS